MRKLIYALFVDQSEAPLQRVAEHPGRPPACIFLLAPENGKGVANLFATLRRVLRPSLAEAAAAWQRACAGQGVHHRQRWLSRDCLPDPGWHKPAGYALACLPGGGGSRCCRPGSPPELSPGARGHRSALRDVPCPDPACALVPRSASTSVLLPRYFPGITRFAARPPPRTGARCSRPIVENGFAGRPSLAILPTGGGKSLYFQLRRWAFTATAASPW